MKGKKVVIVMPAYYAEKTVKRTFDDIPKDLKIKKNIILVDDASTDETIREAKKLGIKTIRHKKNTGYGGNQKTCYEEALKMGADIIVMLHPDYQYDGSMTKELIRPIVDGWLDVMLGNRIRTRREAVAEGGMPIYKYIANRLLTLIENIWLGQNMGEFHSGFRAYSREVLETVPFNNFSDDFIFDQEMLVSAIYSGFKLGQVPVPVRYFDEASSINFKRSSKYGLETLLLMIKYSVQKLRLKEFKIFRSK